QIMETNSGKTVGIIKEFAPNWEPDSKLKFLRLEEVVQKLTEEANVFGIKEFLFAGGIGASEILYKDQEPDIEIWEGFEKQPAEQVLIFQTDNQRYVLREGHRLEIYQNKKTVEVTGEQIKKLKQAVEKKSNERLLQFITNNLPTNIE